MAVTSSLLRLTTGEAGLRDRAPGVGEAVLHLQAVSELVECRQRLHAVDPLVPQRLWIRKSAFRDFHPMGRWLEGPNVRAGSRGRELQPQRHPGLPTVVLGIPFARG